MMQTSIADILPQCQYEPGQVGVVTTQVSLGKEKQFLLFW